MSNRQYFRQKWTRYLGELRPIHDIYINWEAPSPTPSATPTLTPTPSITPTITNSPSVTPSVTNTPSVTPSVTNTPSVTPTCGTVTQQYLGVELQSCNAFKLSLWNNSNLTGAANAVCDVVVSGCATGNSGTTYCGTETILSGQHQHNFNLSGILLPGECVSYFTVYSVTPQCSCYNVTNIPSTSTPTPTPSHTPTLTPTISLTPTKTPTPTVSSTPNAACPTEITLSNFTGATLTVFNGTYQFFEIGYESTATDSYVQGITPSGQSCIVYEKIGGGYYIFCRYDPSTGLIPAVYAAEGYNPRNLTMLLQTTAITDGTYYYPKSGPAIISPGYVSYPVSCSPLPTSTPTVTPTISLTPSITPTITLTTSLTPTISLTPSITPSITPSVSVSVSLTPSVTPTITPSISQSTPTPTPSLTATITPSVTPSITPTCSTAEVTVSNTSLDVPITAVDFNSTPISYVSGTNFTINDGESGTFSTTQFGASVTVDIDYGACTAGQNITIVDCDSTVQCCDLNSGGGTCTFNNVNVSCGCSISISCSDGACF